MNDCFGLISIFSADSRVCQECSEFQACALACRSELQELSEFANLDKAIKKHEKILLSLGFIEDSAKALPRKTRRQNEPNEEVDKLYDFLTIKGLAKEGWIADDLSQAPEFLRLVVEDLQRQGEMNSSDLVKGIGYKLNDKTKALSCCATAVQTLVRFRLVNVEKKGRKQIIKWTLSM